MSLKKSLFKTLFIVVAIFSLSSIGFTAMVRGYGSTSGETKGVSTDNLTVCFWWWALLIVLAAFLVIYGWVFYNKKLTLDWVWPFIAGTLTFIAHTILHRFYTVSKFCPYFVWIDLAFLIIYYITYSYFKNRSQK